MEPAGQADPPADTLPPLLALPDSVLALVAARLPSPDKKAARLVCRALKAAVNAAVTSFLLTDANLPLLAPPDPRATRQQPEPASQPKGHGQQQPLPLPLEQQQHQQQQQQQQHAAARRGTPLHLVFPNLRHLCLALAPSAGPETRAAEQLRCLLRHSLPALRCLRCLDLSLACRDVVLGRTAGEMYDNWTTIVEGLPDGRPVRVLLHPPAALAGAAGGGSGGGHGGPCTAAAAAVAAANGGGGTAPCLLATMLALLGARRPAAEVRLVTAPLASKRYDKPRIPAHAELLAALATPPPGAGGAAGAARRCAAVTGLVLGPESFDPGGDPAPQVRAPAGEGGAGGGGGGGDVSWLPLLAAANARTGASLEELTIWETWPLGLLLAPSPSSSCLLGLRRLVLSDQQAVLDRDRLSADSLAPLSALTRLTRLELASLTVNAAAAAAAVRGGAVQCQRRRGGGGGRGGAPSRVRTGMAARSGKAVAAATRAYIFTPLPQVRHLSVYHALRIIWPPDADGAEPSGAAAAAAAAPLAALFPGLCHLSACVTHGSPGRPASERWAYLAGLGSRLTSLHLRAIAAEDLCLQGRSESLAALSRVTSLRLSAESGKIDGIRGLARTVACLGPGLVALRLSQLGTRGTDPRVAELALPRLTRLDFLGCSGDLVAAFDGVALSAVRLRRLEVRECETVRPGDLQWALERQMGLQQLVIRDCPGLLAAPRGIVTRGSVAAAAALRAALRPSLRLSVATTFSAEARALRHSRRRAGGGGAGGCGGGADGGGGGGEDSVQDVAAAVYDIRTADDMDEL